MVERCLQMVDACLVHLRRVADSKGDPQRREAAAVLSREAMLGRIHYFRVRDHVEQVGPGGRAWSAGCLAGIDGSG